MYVRLEVETEDFMDEVLSEQLAGTPGIDVKPLEYDDVSGVGITLNLETQVSVRHIGLALLAFLQAVDQPELN